MKRGLLAVLSVGVILALGMGPAAAHPVPHAAAAAFAGNATLGGGLYSPVSSTLVTGGTAGTQCDTSATVRVGVCPTPSPLPSWGFTIGLTVPNVATVNGSGGHYQPPGRISASPSPSPFAQVAVNQITGSVGGGTVTPGPTGLGLVGPYCGASGGTGGSGIITIGNPAPAGATVSVPLGRPPSAIGVSNVGWFQSAATVIVYDGDVSSYDENTTALPAAATVTGGITGVVSAIPPVKVAGSNVIGLGSCLEGNATGFVIVGTALAVWFD